MRRTLTIVLLALGAATMTARAAQDDSQALIQIERDWAKAALARDAAALDKIIAADYVYTDSNTNQISKRQLLDGIKSGDSRYETFAVDDLKVYLHGSAAVVTGKATIKGIENRLPIDEQSRFTDTFVKQGGRWVAVATQTTRIPKK